MSNRRTHNKSGRTTVSVGIEEESVVRTWWKRYSRHYAPHLERIQAWYADMQPCLKIKPKDGRISMDGDKPCYAYQLVAWRRFGSEVMAKVAAAKTADDLTISHLCGTEHCCNEWHVIIEPKRVNDERVHCHFCMRNIYTSKGEEGLKVFLCNGGCPHYPPCVTPDLYSFKE